MDVLRKWILPPVYGVQCDSLGGRVFRKWTRESLCWPVNGVTLFCLWRRLATFVGPERERDKLCASARGKDPREFV